MKGSEHVVYKPWGKEVWLELNDRYCYKRIYINAGYKTSFQYHHHKVETNYIISGKAEVWLENDEGIVEKFIMQENDFFNVSPPKKHRVIALTDVILQEVSTPEVNDVIRIEDDTTRHEGKIEGEHTRPAILVLAAGLGTRLSELTEHVNKALLPINGKAIISHIIEKFPKDYDLVIATGYKHESLQEYCTLVYPDRNIQFVYVSDYETNGPGHSALQCKEFLQRPFYLTTADCILNSDLPKLDGNWLGVSITEHPEHYSTVDIDGDDIVRFKNKDVNGYQYAFCGIAGVFDYLDFWQQLEANFDGEVVSAFYTPEQYPTLKVKHIFWLDTGNKPALAHTKKVRGNCISRRK
jgi:choline kinase/mannose-6-phosphate isomerase-like protein (cupin superfamily)